MTASAWLLIVSNLVTFVEITSLLRLHHSGRASFLLALPVSYSFTNNFHSGTLCALRMSADTGNSFGARGTLSSFNPASCGRRLPLREFTSLPAQTRFSQTFLPPRERGITWSRLPSSGRNI